MKYLKYFSASLVVLKFNSTTKIFRITLEIVEYCRNVVTYQLNSFIPLYYGEQTIHYNVTFLPSTVHNTFNFL